MRGKDMDYLLAERGRRLLDDLAASKTLFAFDFDGTLATIVRDRRAAHLTASVRRRLGELGRRAPTVVVSGRSVEDLRARVGDAVPYLVGNHGLEGSHVSPQIVEEAHRICRRWTGRMAGEVSVRLRRAGVQVEDKACSLAFHYRTAERPRLARATVLALLSRFDPLPRIVLGLSVVNAIPDGMSHKGDALVRLMRRLNVSHALYIGDDDTDEDIFALPDERIVTVRVGRKKQSAARFFLRRQSEISAVLRYLTARTGPPMRVKIRLRPWPRACS
jgi:trehalose 6-phosphate phosphatase